ncbi:MAG: hypothetical protein ACE5KH_01390 [Candidatus Geothermarchaeales archaeon]
MPVPLLLVLTLVVVSVMILPATRLDRPLPLPEVREVREIYLGELPRVTGAGWLLKLRQLSERVDEKIRTNGLMASDGGPVFAVAVRFDGWMSVMIDVDGKPFEETGEVVFDESVVPGIYALIAEEAEAMGIQNVPVVFEIADHQIILTDLSSILYGYLFPHGLLLPEDELPPFFGKHGGLPQFKTMGEVHSWRSMLTALGDELDGSDVPYWGSLVVSHGVGADGYYWIGIAEGRVDESDQAVILEIAQEVNRVARGIGFTQEVPLKFSEATGEGGYFDSPSIAFLEARRG